MSRFERGMSKYAMILMMFLGSCAINLPASQPKTDFFVNSMLYSLLIHGESTSELSMNVYRCDGYFYLHSTFKNKNGSILQVLYKLDKVGHIVSREDIGILREIDDDIYIGKSRCQMVRHHDAIRDEDIIGSESLKQK